jgi:ketosteroid isomerase-like protein
LKVELVKNARQLLEDYLANIRTPAIAAALFAADGVVELPTANARAQGPEAIEAFLGKLIKMVPEFRFLDVHVWIETPDKVFAEYGVDATVASTGKRYQQVYAGLLIAEDGKIKLLREAMDTLAAHRAGTPD